MTNNILRVLLIGCACVVISQPASAGDFLVRLRAVTVAPNDGGRNSGLTPDLPTAAVNVGEAYAPEVDVSYFFTPNIAVETICCAAKHGIYGANAIAGLNTAAKTWVTPFTLNAQYHHDFGRFKPYAGAGPVWAIFYGETVTNSLRGALGNGARLNVHQKIGFDVQAGVDVPLGKHWVFNADFKYYFVKPSADFSGGALTRPESFRIKLDPIIAGFGIGYKF